MWVTPHHRPPRPPPPYMCVVANQAFRPLRSFRRLDTGRSAPSTSSASSSHQSRSVRTVGPCVPSARFPAGDCELPWDCRSLPRENGPFPGLATRAGGLASTSCSSCTLRRGSTGRPSRRPVLVRRDQRSWLRSGSTHTGSDHAPARCGGAFATPTRTRAAPSSCDSVGTVGPPRRDRSESLMESGGNSRYRVVSWADAPLWWLSTGWKLKPVGYQQPDRGQDA